MPDRVIIIGSGIAGMVAACYLKKAGFDVTVIERNATPGGRARQFTASGFTFDMGPSWYWMPEVYENFFEDFGYKRSAFYSLKRLDPSYQVYFNGERFSIPAGEEALAELFEQVEPGAGKRLGDFLRDAAYKYVLGMEKFAAKPSLSIAEFFSPDAVSAITRLQLFSSMERHVNRYFQHPLLRQIMQFPVIFLGAMPKHIPAMYSLMNFADTTLGTWYPEGGMYRIVEAVYQVADSLGVRFIFNEDVKEITVKDGVAKKVKTANESYDAEVVIGAGDYHFMEQLLPEHARQYAPSYWNSRKMAPSCLLFYVGIDKRLPLAHHSLFFDTSFEQHASALYEDPRWPDDPLFYVCTPSVTDDTVAPDGCENLFILIPVAAGLEGDDEVLRKKYFRQIQDRLEKVTGVSLTDHIVYYKSYGVTDFQTDYHAYRGNAYGLANTLRQTAFGKPRMRSRKVSNLFFAGQLTVPGPGLPPAFLSGKMAAQEATRYLHTQPSLEPNITTVHA